MCGILGSVAFGDSQVELTSADLAAMRDSMRHRGPDGAGFWIAPHRKAALAHRRLSILDLSAVAAQPMCNEDGSISVVFNGEIYNHAEIRAELESAGGHRWRSDHSDTEVIVHAFEQWGIDCLQKFRGMFAIGIWDDRRRELWLVRDRMGIKPLYYAFGRAGLTFASEIKALLADRRQERKLDEQAFYHYLSFLTTPAPATMFRGIRKLPPATWVRVKQNGAIQEHRFWDPFDHTQPLVNSSEDEIAERLRHELRTSVTLRKLSDVPVGVFLSGGIDSSANAALFSEGESQPIRTFSIGYDGEYASCPSELPYARHMAHSVGSEHHEFTLRPHDLIDFLPKMIELQDEPIADPVCVPIYFVSKLAREHGVVVCQLGEGADELFCGYRSWRASMCLQVIAALPVPTMWKRCGLAALDVAGHGNSRACEWLRRDISGTPIFWGGAEGFGEQQKQRLISTALRSRLGEINSWDVLRPVRERYHQKAWEKTPLSWMSYLDLSLRLPELLLMRVDKMSMGVSLEARVPFLDHKFVEYALSIPTPLKTRRGKLKYILRKAMEPLLPREILHRRKQGFGIPLSDWFKGSLGALARQELTYFCRNTDLLNPAEVERVLRSGDPRRAWYLLNFALWWKHYIAGNAVGEESSAEKMAVAAASSAAV